MRILFIDEELKPIEVYIDKLKEIGHDVVHVRKLRDVLTLLSKDTRFDRVITDIMLPSGDVLDITESQGGLISGELFIKNLRELLPGVKITVLTNVNDTTILARVSEKVDGRCYKKREIKPNLPEHIAKLIG